MDSRTCPKCGAREKKGNPKSYSVWACGTTNPVGDLLNEARYCLRRQLAAMTARAEKAEAEAHRAQCFIAQVCADFGRGCAYCNERRCPNYPVEVEP